jgi:hypothetical protein
MSGRGIRRLMARLTAAALLGAAFAAAPAAPAQALDFQCIEPSRYKNLLPVFNDDPNVFFSYFGLPRGRLPDLEIYRALHVSGTLADGDADALLDRIIQGKGWLAALHLSFEGTNLEEEARIAVIIRSFALKTRAIRSEFSIYGPDFVIRWEPPLRMTGTSAAAPQLREDISPLTRGIRTYQLRRDLRLKLDPNRSTCNDGCRTAWFAGVNRLYNQPAANPKPAPDPDPAVNRRRVALTYQVDFNRTPAPNDAMLGKPLEWTFISSPAMARTLRDKCHPEMVVAEALEARWGEAFDNAAKANFRPRDVEALGGVFESLSRGGARLQKCLAAAMETERLAAFQRHCGTAECDKKAMSERAATAARDLLEKADKIPAP